MFSLVVQHHPTHYYLLFPRPLSNIMIKLSITEHSSVSQHTARDMTQDMAGLGSQVQVHDIKQ